MSNTGKLILTSNKIRIPRKNRTCIIQCDYLNKATITYPLYSLISAGWELKIIMFNLGEKKINKYSALSMPSFYTFCLQRAPG